jgi:1,5-anhydro-D-fructose reductase (1,5-anhydro-D-mannitol-forming)
MIRAAMLSFWHVHAGGYADQGSKHPDTEIVAVWDEIPEGLPESVSAHYGYMTGKEVEDNAVSVLKYRSGALGIVEAGFVTAHTPFSIEIHGQDGSLFFGIGTPKEQQLLKTNRLDETAAKQWTEPPLLDKVPSAFDQWVGHILNNTTASENIQLAVDLTRLTEASNLSAAQSRSVPLSELKE